MQLSRKEVFEAYIVSTFNSASSFICKAANSALNGLLTIDCWSASICVPILEISRNVLDERRKPKSIPIGTLNTVEASKSSESLLSIVRWIHNISVVIGSDEIGIHTTTSDNEAPVAMACDLLTNDVGYVSCAVLTLDLCVNYVFKPDKTWKKHMEHVNKVTSYLIFNINAMILLLKKRLQSGVT